MTTLYVVYTGREDGYVDPNYFKDPAKAEKFQTDAGAGAYEECHEIDLEDPPHCQDDEVTLDDE